jgi:RNA polymerase sigma-70 factor (ECF subfamily)
VEDILIKRIKEGDNTAFEELYNGYADYALRTAMAVTGSKASAADAVQETFIRIYRNINSFEEDKPFKPWFYKILINECNRIMGKSSKLILMDDFTQDNLQEPVKDDYAFEEYESLYKAIEDLEDINKVPIILKYLRDFKDSEIAEVLGININTVKSRLFKGRQKLQKLIEKLEKGSRGDGSYGR